MNMRIAAILLLGYCAGMSTPAFAQKKDKLKKGPNISLNISHIAVGKGPINLEIGATQ